MTYCVTEIDPIDVEFDEEHLLTFVLVCFKAGTIIRNFLLFDLTNQLIELLEWLDLNELVGTFVSRVGQDDPQEEADETIIHAELKFGKEEQRDYHDSANGKAVEEELPKGGGAEVVD